LGKYNHYEKKGVLQLALQLNFWVANDTYDYLYLYVVNVNGQVTWVATHHIYGATHCNLIVIMLKQFIFNYYATLL